MNYAELRNLIIIISISSIICIFCGIIIPNILQHKKYNHWDGGILKEHQKILQIHCPFDPSKEILYISRRVVGFWETFNLIHTLNNKNENMVILRTLAKTYNLILYIPEWDQHDVRVINLDPSIRFIVDNNFPICYITQHMPPRSKVEPFSVNDDKLWFLKYKSKEGESKWEGYM